MRTETKFVIDHFERYAALVAAIKTVPESEKIHYMKINLDLHRNTELTQVQCNLFYTALNNVEWDIVIKAMEEREQ